MRIWPTKELETVRCRHSQRSTLLGDVSRSNIGLSWMVLVHRGAIT